MPWQECHQMDERLRFVARRLDGEKMAVLCQEFGISRKTGYKIFSRYKDCGLDGLTDRSRRPYRHARQLPFQIEKAIIQLKQEHPSWGAPKLRERLRRQHSDVHCPAISTVHAILDRHGLVKRRRRRVYKPEGTALSRPYAPNDLWCADYKGEFMLADKRYCYPFTSTFNQERPHEALNMRYPAELYSPSPRPYNGLPALEYPFHDRTITVTRCGRICMGPLKINLSQAFAGQRVGVKQVEEKIWRVSFMRYDLGFFDHETCRIESAENPFAAKLSPMSPV